MRMRVKIAFIARHAVWQGLFVAVPSLLLSQERPGHNWLQTEAPVCSFGDRHFIQQAASDHREVPTQNPMVRRILPNQRERQDGDLLTVRTTVPCVNGKLEGSGKVQFLRKSVPQFEYNVGPEYGIIYRAGYLAAIPDTRKIRTRLRTCERATRELEVSVPDGYALWSSELTDSLANLTGQELQLRCALRATSGRKTVWVFGYVSALDSKEGETERGNARRTVEFTPPGPATVRTDSERAWTASLTSAAQETGEARSANRPGTSSRVSSRTVGLSGIKPSDSPGEVLVSAKTAYVMHECAGTVRDVFGVVADGISLSDDREALRWLADAVAFAQTQCPRPITGTGKSVFDQRGGGFNNITVHLRRGVPSTLAQEIAASKRLGHDRVDRYRHFVNAYPVHLVRARNYSVDSLTWREFTNSARQAKESAERETSRRIAQEQAQQRALEIERARVISERQRTQAIQSRSSAFLRSYRVDEYTSIASLSANPFAHKGKIVAAVVSFDQMTAANAGVFSRGTNLVYVSNVPSTRFVRTGELVVLAGRVIGNSKINLPLFGEVLVPHLSFVGSASCKEAGCADYSLERR